MRVATALCLAGLIALVCGCGSRPEAGQPRGPLFAGRLEGGSYWKNPVGSSSNEGGQIEKGSRVEVYDQFIAVTSPGGLSRVLPHGYYSDLVIKKD
jgi:hypothetical protein